MQVTVDELRRRYELFSDEALAAAHDQGQDAYLPSAWSVITEEMARRGMITPRAEGGPPGESKPLTPAAAEHLVEISLLTGVSHAKIASRLREGGLADTDIEWIMSPILERWRATQEKRARSLIRSGAMWAVGGFLITALTYASALNSGGSYFITWGAMLYGVLRFAEGLTLFRRARQR